MIFSLSYSSIWTSHSIPVGGGNANRHKTQKKKEEVCYKFFFFFKVEI